MKHVNDNNFSCIIYDLKSIVVSQWTYLSNEHYCACLTFVGKVTCSLPFCVPPKTEHDQQDAEVSLWLVVTWEDQAPPPQPLNVPEMQKGQQTQK